MKIFSTIIKKPDGQPYLSVRHDNRLAYIQIHDYDYLGDPVEFNFDLKALPELISALKKLDREYKNQDKKHIKSKLGYSRVGLGNI